MPQRLPGVPSRRDGIVLGLLVLGGAALRFAALDHGIPFQLAADEPQVMERAVRMMKTGSYHPYFFDYPTLYLYVQVAVATARFLAGALAGLWSSLDQTATADYYVWGRAVTATLGTATIALTYQAARRFGPLAAATAGLLMAVQPNHVRESRYVLVDVPMTFFVALALLLAIRAWERRTASAFVWAGVAAGLAAATKYPGGVALVMPLAALLVTRDGPPRLRTAAATIGAAALAFLIWAPYTVLDLPAFLDGFGQLAGAHAAGTAPAQPAWWLYVLHLRSNLGFLGVMLAGASVAVALVAALRPATPARAAWAVGASFVLVFYVVIARQTIVYARYLLPLLPSLFVLAGGTVAALAGWAAVRLTPRWRAALVTAVLMAVALPPTLRATGLIVTLSKTSSNALAYAWILEHVPAGSTVALEVEGMILPDRYRTLNVESLISHDLAYYEDEGVDYVVTSSQRNLELDVAGSSRGLAYRNLLRGMDLMTVISPSADAPGSEIRVYRLLR